MTPSRPRRRQHREPDDPTETRPWQQHRRRPRHVGQHVGRELVHGRRGEGGGETEAEPARCPHHARPGGEEQRGDPQPMGHPVRQPDRLTDPVPRPLRPEVGDRLVRHPTGELAPVERPGGIGDQAAGIEVQVQLGVGRHPPGGRPQRGHVGDQGEEPDGQPGRSDDAGAAAPARRPTSWTVVASSRIVGEVGIGRRHLNDHAAADRGSLVIRVRGAGMPCRTHSDGGKHSDRQRR